MSKEPIRVKVQTAAIVQHGESFFFETESEKIIDHSNPSDRKWLGSHCFWAMRNGRRVTTTPIC